MLKAPADIERFLPQCSLLGVQVHTGLLRHIVLQYSQMLRLFHLQ